MPTPTTSTPFRAYVQSLDKALTSLQEAEQSLDWDNDDSIPEELSLTFDSTLHDLQLRRDVALREAEMRGEPR